MFLLCTESKFFEMVQGYMREIWSGAKFGVDVKHPTEPDCEIYAPALRAQN